MKRTLTVILLLLFAASAVLAQTSAQKERKAKLERDIAILNSQLKENSKKSGRAESSLKLTRSKISSRRKLLKETEAEIKSLDESISAKNDTITLLQARLDTMSANYSRLVRTAYRSRDSRLWYMYMLASENLGQGLRRFGYLRSLSQQMRGLASRLKDAKAALEAQKLDAEKLKASATALRQSRLADLDRLGKEEGEAKRLVAQLGKDKQRYQRQLASKRREQAALDREIRSLLEKATKPPSGGKTVIDTKLDAEFSANKGRLPWPADGPVIDGFGVHYHPVYKKIKLPFNNGINIALSPNTAVKSVFSGTVRQVIVMPGYNQCVLVQHGGYFTFYCKLTNVSVKAGDKVKTGQVLGIADTIGGDTQLHFELWEGKSPRDPELWLK